MTASLGGGAVFSQIPVELFVGQNRTTLDVMFFRFFEDSQERPSKLLLFNRNRAGIDRAMSPTSNLPQFGFTEALSYNHPKLNGIAPVFVVQVFNSGAYTKAGIQYAFLREKVTLFSWLVSETERKPALDHYLLLRFTPGITNELKLFSQIESLSTFPTDSDLYSFTQRIRLGVEWRGFQFGAGSDLTERSGHPDPFSSNTGLFLRYDFK
ncbi:MAG TPA: hypothetical protein P5550_02425 [Bacteroidales bacterium]|nr:hypothetical protein [Bacteroidales bacterium]HRZ76013.1 hypothetical protein [Bacteroidales bacterium]